MSTLEVILLITTVLIIFIPVSRRYFKRLPRWLDFAPIVPLLLAIANLMLDGFQMYMIVIYIPIGVIFLQSIRYMVKPDTPVKQSRMQVVMDYAGVIIGVVVLLLGLWYGPMMASASAKDLHTDRWSTAFRRMNDTLSKRYGFTAWKQIDWEALDAEYAPRIVAAEQSGDMDAYYLALREYFFSIPDGHIKFSGGNSDVWHEAIDGGFGLAVIKLDDDSVIAHVLVEGGPAADAGMTWGAEIIEWDGSPILEALEKVSPIWLGVPPATREGLSFAQQNLITRAPVGTEVNITYINDGETTSQSVWLSAIDDGMEPLFASLGQRASMRLRREMGDEGESNNDMRPPDFSILPEGYGYLHVYHVIPQEGDPDFVAIVDQAINEFVAQDVPGVIIDVRGNPGGFDQLVPQMMGYFFTKPDFYEYMYFDNWLTGISLMDPSVGLTIEPKTPHYDGPFAVLVDLGTLSSGEGFPLIAQRLPQGVVVGIYGTNGSFGMCCGTILLPGDFRLQYPVGQSLNAQRKVQLDSDHTLQGGVSPDIRVPLTRDTVQAMFLEGEDLVLNYAIAAIQAP